MKGSMKCIHINITISKATCKIVSVLKCAHTITCLSPTLDNVSNHPHACYISIHYDTELSLPS